MVQDIHSIQPMANSDTAKKAKDPVLQEYEEGKKYLANNEFGQAAVSLHNALLGYEEKADKKGIANASNQLGIVCLRRKDYKQAEKHFLRCLDLCNEMNDAVSVVSVKKQLIELYQNSGQFDMAIDQCMSLFDWYTANNDPQGTVYILEVMAEIYQEKDEPAKSADAYRTIASIHKNFKHLTIADRYLAKAAALESAK